MIIIVAIIKLIVILCAVTIIHEIGHFTAAKLLKIDVNEFSVGFGPKIVQKKYKDTMYSIRWLPLGGYVLIEGEGEDSDKDSSLTKRNAFQKILVFVMGVVFNVILALVILISTSFTSSTYTTEITSFTENSVIKDAGLLPGDIIKKINGDNVSLAQDLINSKYSENSITKIEYSRNGVTHEVTLTNAIKEVGYIGAAFTSNGDKGTNKIDSIRPGRPAEKAGLKAGDIILDVNNIPVEDSYDIISMIKQNANKEMTVLVERNGVTSIKTIVPELQKQFDLGIYETKEVKTNLVYAFDKSVKIVASVASSYIDLFRGKLMLDDVSSIVGIGVVVSKTSGIIEYLNMLAIISLAIGVANLLPFPPLDGGKILFVLIGAITRRKIPASVEAIVSFIGFGALILLTIVVTYKDIVRIF